MASFTDENGIFWADPDDVGYGPGSNPPKTTPIQRVIDSFAGIPCQWRRPDDATVAPGQICGLIHDRCTGHFHARTDKEERIPLKGNPCGGVARLGATICRLHAPSGNARRGGTEPPCGAGGQAGRQAGGVDGCACRGSGVGAGAAGRRDAGVERGGPRGGVQARVDPRRLR
jgi:hypothetical protein